jgi:hypothetical protein
MLNATGDNNDVIGQVVNLKYCVMHQIECPASSRFTNYNHENLCHITAGTVKIQRYILFCRIVKSAEQSKHQLLVSSKYCLHFLLTKF